ncbi:hypothetical protein [Streptomyces sp. BPTC-684]|uniref:hypothetical protein n=1 Tax=Streptomyces sp. BPTC-684 TaxID=3043734 RepID=UPI0024B0C18D|nr:hypothetical protein [Streptomyces sp. BPTC-684]WHM35634.1 hypothetical protein QIY60_01095 [Streptomyces sp. BPTC-684]
MPPNQSPIQEKPPDSSGRSHVQDNEIVVVSASSIVVKVTPPHDNPVTHGNLCIKGRFGFRHVQNRE